MPPAIVRTTITIPSTIIKRARTRATKVYAARRPAMTATRVGEFRST
jgi:hypothetical protein